MTTRAIFNLAQAEREIKDFFQQYNRLVGKSYSRLTKGKIYELYCLSRVIEWLKDEYGFSISIHSQSQSIDFKASPGKIDRNKSFFIARAPRGIFEIHTDIEIMALGAINQLHRSQIYQDRSAYHEIDIVVIHRDLSRRPRYDELILGVECKADAHFRKSILKQVLGIRRELSLLTPELPSLLAEAVGRNSPRIPACPGSEYWLAYVDPKGGHYQFSPSFFGIEFRHWCP